MRAAAVAALTPPLLQICDFGLARAKESTATMTAIGTPQWAAPEVLRHDRYSEKADVWSFGVVLWELLVTSPPFHEVPALQVAIDVRAAPRRHCAPGSQPRPAPAPVQVGHNVRRLPTPLNTPEPLAAIYRQCCSGDPALRPTFAQLVTLLAHAELQVDPRRGSRGSGRRSSGTSV